VTALNETQVLTLSRQDFMATLERNHEAMRKMLALLARTVRRSTSRVEDLVFLDLTGRVAKCLIARTGGQRARAEGGDSATLS